MLKIFRFLAFGDIFPVDYESGKKLYMKVTNFFYRIRNLREKSRLVRKKSFSITHWNPKIGSADLIYGVASWRVTDSAYRTSNVRHYV